MKRNLLKIGAAVCLVAVLATACGSDKTDSATTATTKPATKEASTGGSMSDNASGKTVATETGASELRAGLTYLLEEHVYLAGAAISTAVGKGGNMDDPAVKAAVGALDDNSVALSKAIGSVYGDAGGEQFLALWRKHIGFFVDYTLGGATKDQAKQDKARQELDGYRNDFGAFLESATKGALPKQAVADELKPHVESLEAVIDAILAGSPDVAEKSRIAADHMPMTAKVLADAIAKQFPDKFDGSVDGPAAELRSGLTALLTEHVYLAGSAIGTAVGKGGNMDDPAVKAAVGALDENSVALSKAVGSVYGDAGGEQFLALWRKHIGFFVDYTLGGATKDQAKQDKARKDLDGYRNDFGAFLESATKGGLTQQAVADELTPHVQSLEAAIDAILAGSPDVAAKARTAAGHMPMTAKVLAGAIAQQFPDKFKA